MNDGSYVERLSATTRVLDVGIPECEFRAVCKEVSRAWPDGRDMCTNAPELVLCPVHLRANNGEQGLGVYEDLDAVLLDNLVEFAGLVDVLEVVGEPRAAPVLHADADQLRVRLREQVLQVLYRDRRQRYRGLSWP